MTVLATKETRDLIGIDSWERAIVWSACSLLSAKSESTTVYDKNFSVFADQTTAQILISFGMPLDMPLFWASMGDPDLSLQNITDLTVNYEGEYLSLSTPLETEPPSVNTLEKYFVWANKKLLEYYLKNDTDKANNINLSTDLKRSAIFVTTTLPYDPIDYSETDSLLSAVVVTSSSSSNVDGLFGNNTLLSNNLLLSN